MKKVLITIAMVALTFSMNAQSYKVKMMDGQPLIGVKFTLEVTDTAFTLNAMGNEDVIDVVLVSDDGKIAVYDAVGGANKARYTLIKWSKRHVLKTQMIDSFTNEVTTLVWSLKLVK